jgi:hypothetical protein
MGKFKQLAYELSQMPDMLTEEQMNAAIKQYYAEMDANLAKLERKAAAYDRAVSIVLKALIVISCLGVGSFLAKVGL